MKLRFGNLSCGLKCENKEARWNIDKPPRVVSHDSYEHPSANLLFASRILPKTFSKKRIEYFTE